jgi:hypothetical protein
VAVDVVDNTTEIVRYVREFRHATPIQRKSSFHMYQEAHLRPYLHCYTKPPSKSSILFNLKVVNTDRRRAPSKSGTMEQPNLIRITGMYAQRFSHSTKHPGLLSSIAGL